MSNAYGWQSKEGARQFPYTIQTHPMRVGFFFFVVEQLLDYPLFHFEIFMLKTYNGNRRSFTTVKD